jgi:excisionase family DNA binding protein
VDIRVDVVGAFFGHDHHHSKRISTVLVPHYPGHICSDTRSPDDFSEHNRSQSRPPNNLEPIRLGNDRLVFSVAEAGELLGLSRAFAYELVARGELPIIHFGRRIVVPKAALLALLGSALVDDSNVHCADEVLSIGKLVVGVEDCYPSKSTRVR